MCVCVWGVLLCTTELIVLYVFILKVPIEILRLTGLGQINCQNFVKGLLTVHISKLTVIR